jgi:maleate isomerase
MVATEPVSFEVEMAPGEDAVHLGLITLHTDETTERDFHNLLPQHSSVMFYTTRIATVNPVTLENLRKMGPQLSAAASLLLPDVDIKAVAYSCTSGTLAMGYDEVARQVRAGFPEHLKKQLTVVTPLTAAVDAFRTIGVRKLAMVTPYIDSVNQPMIRFFEDRGLKVKKLKSLLVESDVDIARVHPSSILKAAREAAIDDADALFLSCTALRAVECIETLERELNLPVFSSNQCMLWALLTAAGYTQPIPGGGRLLASL